MATAVGLVIDLVGAPYGGAIGAVVLPLYAVVAAIDLLEFLLAWADGAVSFGPRVVRVATLMAAAAASHPLPLLVEAVVLFGLAWATAEVLSRLRSAMSARV